MAVILLVLRTAVSSLLAAPSALIRQIWPPLLLLVIGTALSVASISTEALGSVLSFVGYILLAVAVHRYILADELVDKDDGLAKASFLYFLWLIGIGLVSAFVFMLPTLLLLQFGVPAIVILVTLPVAYVTSRMSLVLPDRAIGRDTEINVVWAISQGNGWKLTIILALLPIVLSLPFGLLQWVLPGGLYALVEVLTAAPLIILNVALLSVAYRQLSEMQQPEL